MSSRAQDLTAVSGSIPADARVAELYARHHDRVYRLALRYGRGDPSWAEDVVHDVFVVLCQSIDGLDDLDDAGGWLYRVTTNACLGRLRRQRIREALGLRWLIGTEASPAADLEASFVERDDLARVAAALDHLPPRERVAFCMYHLDGRAQDEIASVLGVSKSRVCRMIQRANARIASRIGGDDGRA